LSLVLMPLFSLIMWQALKPFRRLTTMVNPNSEHFGGTHDAFGHRQSKHRMRNLARTGVATLAGGAAGAAAAEAMDDDDEPSKVVPDRAEARPSPHAPVRPPLALEAAAARTTRPEDVSAGPALHAAAAPTAADERQAPVFEAGGGDHRRSASRVHAEHAVGALNEGFVPRPSAESAPPPPPVATEPEWYDGEAVYPIYRPSEQTDDVA
jgi:hypothetical protein